MLGMRGDSIGSFLCRLRALVCTGQLQKTQSGNTCKPGNRLISGTQEPRLSDVHPEVYPQEAAQWEAQLEELTK